MLAVGIFRHGVDGEVAAQQIFCKRHSGAGVEFKTLVARCHLALGACQRIFLFAVRVQKHREILADLLVAQCQHLLRCCPDHYPVALLHRQAQQLVAHRAADQEDFHQGARRDRER